MTQWFPGVFDPGLIGRIKCKYGSTESEYHVHWKQRHLKNKQVQERSGTNTTWEKHACQIRLLSTIPDLGTCARSMSATRGSMNQNHPNRLSNLSKSHVFRIQAKP